MLEARFLTWFCTDTKPLQQRAGTPFGEHYLCTMSVSWRLFGRSEQYTTAQNVTPHSSIPFKCISRGVMLSSPVLQNQLFLSQLRNKTQSKQHQMSDLPIHCNPVLKSVATALL